MKAYVLVKKGYEYDDNIYNEIDGGTPKLIIFGQEEVKEKVKKANIEEFRNISIHDYGYDMSEILNVDQNQYLEFNKSLVEKYGPIKTQYSWHNTEYMLHTSANEEECDNYLKMVNIRFYEAVETDIDLQSYREHKLSEIIK
jgi:hypothetical protein